MEKQAMQIFENEEFGTVRGFTIDGEPWFVGHDVAKALGYLKPENAVAAHVDDEDKTTTLIQGSGSNYKTTVYIINESGLYSLIFSSKLEKARQFKRWVTSEVLPSLRKNGYYKMENGGALVFCDAYKVAKLISCTPENRLNMVTEILKKAGVDIPDPEPYPGPPIATSGKYESVRKFLQEYGDPTGKVTSEVYEIYMAQCEDQPISKIVFSKVVNQTLGTEVNVAWVDGKSRRVFVK